MTKFEVAVEDHVAERVGAVVEAHIEESTAWWSGQLAAVHAIGKPAVRRAELAKLRAERDRRRAAGEHFDTMSSVIVYQLLAVLDGKGWRGRRWRPIPHGEGELPGRRWGVAPNSRGYLSGRLRVHLPADLAELMRRATWWTSAPATTRLQELAGYRTLSADQLAERTRLRTQVITTGDLIREAADQLLPRS
ncbi:hypothetical protein [Amycolatopsis sp. NBC_01480]|uniref:hypothetical protein n=1 Tax=Amycolatopsis sp. NBC_01480 TaxID=2903562 RepID=UPI002E2D9661|nr:hypothetical protein [Amycolatopsis sp. NBC_01480]